MKKEKFIQKIIERTQKTLTEMNDSNIDTYDLVMDPNYEQFIIGVNGTPIYTGLTEEARLYHKENDIKIKDVYNRFFKDNIIQSIHQYRELRNNQLNCKDFNEQYKDYLLELYPNNIECRYQEKTDSYDFIYKQDHVDIVIHGQYLYDIYLRTNTFLECDNTVNSIITRDTTILLDNINPLLQNFGSIRDYIYPSCLSHSQSLKENECVDMTTPYKLYFFINFSEIMPSLPGKIIVTNELLQNWNITKDELREIAISNLYRDLPQEETKYEVWDGNTLILKNDLVGSAIILNEAIKDEIIEKLNYPSEYYILGVSTPTNLEINTTGIEPFINDTSQCLFPNNIGIHIELNREMDQDELDLE